MLGHEVTDLLNQTKVLLRTTSELLLDKVDQYVNTGLGILMSLAV